MVKKVLFVATTAKTHINTFHLPYIAYFKSIGWQVDVATNGDARVQGADTEYTIPITRSPFRLSNIKALLALKRIIKEQQYQLVTCHTPMGGVVGRLAAKMSNSPAILYTAHGFHFFKGASLINWCLYYPVEKILAHITDGLVTMNEEDYSRAKAFGAKHIYYIHGIGFNYEKYARPTTIDTMSFLNSLGLTPQNKILLSVGEINANKNHEVILRALAQIGDSNIHYLVAGHGDKTEFLRNLAATLGLEQNVHFLGYRSDIAQLHQVADIFCFPSKREGLAVAALEAMASGLPLVSSNIRGIINTTDFKYKPNDINGFATGIKTLLTDDALRKEIGDNNRLTAKQYSLNVALGEMAKIYDDFI